MFAFKEVPSFVGLSKPHSFLMPRKNLLFLVLLDGRIIFWAYAKLLQQDALPQPALLHHKSTGTG
jgi:hypothetical protein